MHTSRLLHVHGKHAATMVCQIALNDCAKSGGTLTYPPCMAVKMVATPIALHCDQKETCFPGPFKFFGMHISKQIADGVTLFAFALHWIPWNDCIL